MHIWTETPETELWRHIRYFRSPANVQNLLCGKTGSKRTNIQKDNDVLKRRAYDISACIRQADEYYHSASTVGLSTSPLLQFYGALSLAKAITIANDPTANLADLRYHGLSTRLGTVNDVSAKKNLESYTKTNTAWEIEKEFAVTHQGVFPHFCAVASDFPPPQGEVILFKDLIGMLPDMNQMYNRHYGESSKCFYLYEDPVITKTGNFEIAFSSELDLDAIKVIFPEFTTGYEEFNRGGNGPGFRSVSHFDKIPNFIKIVKGTVAGNYLVRPHSSGIFTSTCVQFAALFILSNIVRYKPDFWMGVIEGESSGSASVVEMFCNHSRRRYPGDILELFWNEEFTFGTPGYLS